MDGPKLKELVWIASSLDDLREFPEDVKDVMGYALFLAQSGGKHQCAKPMKGFGGAGVLEVVDDFDVDTYRTVYTVKLAGVVYVLHAFQKKAHKGIETPKNEIDVVKARYRQALQWHQQRTAARPEERR